MKILQDIQIVTHCVENLDVEVTAWINHLNYRLVEQGKLPAALCRVWDTPAEIGAPYALLQPASNEPVYLRFIETDPRPGYLPNLSWGWNATEILVKDPDTLALQLQDSPFNAFFGPFDLTTAPKAPRVLQAFGPAGEVLYFSRLLPGGSRYGLKGAKCPVDRVFNVVLGGPSMTDLHYFYSTTMGLRTDDPIPFIGTLAAKACGEPADKNFPIAVGRLKARRSILELDEYPAMCHKRPRNPGCLPGGMSMVSFRVNDLCATNVSLRAEPQRIASIPYAGRRTAIICGPAGEWLELIEGD